MDAPSPAKCGIGIDISKGQCTVSTYAGVKNKIKGPKVRKYKHTQSELKDLVEFIKSLDYEIKVVLEDTGVYSIPVIKFMKQHQIFISSVNPLIIKNFYDNQIHGIKTDKQDSIKIARYAYMYFEELEEYQEEDELRYKLKLLNRARESILKQQTMNKNSLIDLLDKTFPGINNLFTSKMRENGSQKWIDFVSSFWHSECVSKLSLPAFKDRYQRFCERNHYNYSESKAEEIYEFSKQCIPVLTKDQITKDLFKLHYKRLKESIDQNITALEKMTDIAEMLPEYPVVKEMAGVGRILAPQLIAEIGDVRRFKNRRSIVAFAGVDPGMTQSGEYEQKSNPTSHAGTTYLRKTLFLVISSLLQHKPDDPVYKFVDKKRSEGKPYKVYVTAGSNKFLRIYYGKVKEFLENESQ